VAELSPWRAMARRVIAKALADNPQAITYEQMRRVASNAYPFGERKNHPYKMWLTEVKLALKTVPKSHEVSRLEWNPELKVRCGHCQFRGWKSCLYCFGFRDQLAAIEVDRVCVEMFAAVRAEPSKASYSALADLLRDKHPMFAKLADLFETLAGEEVQ
jgi:hypothetical protein